MKIKQIASLTHLHHRFSDLSRCQRTLAKSLNEFNFECIGSTQTDDEQVIADSLKQFGKLISAIEDERDNMVTMTGPIWMWRQLNLFVFYSLTELMTRSLFHWKLSGKTRSAVLRRRKSNMTKELQNFARHKKRFWIFRRRNRSPCSLRYAQCSLFKNSFVCHKIVQRKGDFKDGGREIFFAFRQTSDAHVRCSEVINYSNL